MAAVPKIILAGGSGFLGRTLARWHSVHGRDVVVFSRAARDVPGARTVLWDGERLGPWARELEGATALINLTGRSVNCRYTAHNRREIMDSRILSTRVIGEAVARCELPPAVWLNSSTATIYRHTFVEAHDEATGELGAAAEAKDAFSIDVARAWEAEFHRFQCPHTRTATLRTAVVFGNEPGCAYEMLRRLVRCGLGGQMGDGHQFVSWIHAEDFCRAIDWIIDHPDHRGIYNICAPNPVTNRELMRTLRGALGMPFGLPAARWMLEIGAWFLRTETELILKSRRVIPGRLLKEGFVFTHSDLTGAIRSLEEARRSVRTMRLQPSQ